jgi:hypothetical protein
MQIFGLLKYFSDFFMQRESGFQGFVADGDRWFRAINFSEN